MCIIVAKRKNVEIPSNEILKNCFNNNHDGAGLMYSSNGKVVIEKGFMKFDDFKKRLDELKIKYNDFKGKSLVMHFRIGTAGSNTAENTHPYPLSGHVEDIHATKIISSVGVAHNGIISEFNPSKENPENVNDTQNFIMKFLTPLYNGYKDFYKNDKVLSGIYKMLRSANKLAFLDGASDEIYLTDGFQTDANGVEYSNNTYSYSYDYINTKYSSAYQTSWNWWKQKEKEKKRAITHKTEFLTPLLKGQRIRYEDGVIETVHESHVYYIYRPTQKLYIDDNFGTECLGFVVKIYDKDGHRIYEPKEEN